MEKNINNDIIRKEVQKTFAVITAISVVISIVLCAIWLFSISYISSNSELLITRSDIAINARHMSENLARQELSAMSMVYNTDTIPELIEEYDNYIEEYQTFAYNVEALTSDITIKEFVDEIDSAWTKYMIARTVFIEEVGTLPTPDDLSHREMAVETAVKNFLPAFDKLKESTNNLATYSEALSDPQIKNLDLHSLIIIKPIFRIAIFAVITAVLTNIFLGSAFNKKLKRLLARQEG